MVPVISGTELGLLLQATPATRQHALECRRHTPGCGRAVHPCSFFCNQLEHSATGISFCNGVDTNDYREAPPSRQTIQRWNQHDYRCGLAASLRNSACGLRGKNKFGSDVSRVVESFAGKLKKWGYPSPHLWNHRVSTNSSTVVTQECARLLVEKTKIFNHREHRGHRVNLCAVILRTALMRAEAKDLGIRRRLLGR
jgi:hypothetical protein